MDVPAARAPRLRLHIGGFIAEFIAECRVELEVSSDKLITRPFPQGTLALSTLRLPYLDGSDDFRPDTAQAYTIVPRSIGESVRRTGIISCRRSARGSRTGSAYFAE